MPNIGWTELIVILVIILVIFGPKRLPEIGRSLGKGIKEFKKSSTELTEQLTAEEPKAPTVEKTEKVEETTEAPVAGPEPNSSENSST
ncbi:MAG: twin-arginine translocase TatA/TatE family subunit [Gaiellales bacterium]|nr:MAG: twin-arginine translocase TatA/TatE family subunit [Gaiellales bacterium]